MVVGEGIPHPFISALCWHLFLLSNPASQIIQILFYEILAFDLFLFATLSLSAYLLKTAKNLSNMNSNRCMT